MRSHLQAAVLVLTAAASLCVPTGPAHAGRGELSASLTYRYLQSMRTSLRLDEEGSLAGGETLGEHRFRIATDAYYGDAWAAVFEGEFAGLIQGDTASPTPRQALLPPDQTDGGTGFFLRQAYAQHAGVLGLMRLGIMSSQWGLGILANDGSDPDPFGHGRVGDVAARALWATRPFAYGSSAPWAQEFLIAAAFDTIVRDENASFADGDRAYQGIVSVLWQRHRRALGAYFVRRQQEDLDGDELSASVGDVFFRYRKSFRLLDVPPPAGAGAIELSGEGVLVKGDTTRVITHNAREGLDVLALGWVLRGDIELGAARLRLETGYASGDDNPEDAESRRFGFDPDYQVGLIMFDEVMARRSVRTVQRIANPERSNRPPKGSDSLITDGRLTGATYFYPTMRVKLRPWLEASAGMVLAWTSATDLDPYTTFQAGGAPRDGFDRPASGRFIGTEALGGLKLGTDEWLSLPFVVGMQAGVFVPDDQDDLTITKVVVHAGIGQ